MKNILVVLLVLIGFASVAQEKKQPLSPAVTVEKENFKVVYGQPSKNGREIFGQLVPYGKVWRTGANAATEIEFKKDVNFAGKNIKAGTYTLFTIPGEKEWTVILNSELKQFGAFKYDKVVDKNVAEVKVAAKKSTKIEEKLIIDGNNNALIIAWDDVVVTVPLKF